MPDLPEVTQEFTANVQPYIDALARAAAAAKAFAEDADKAGAAAGVFGMSAKTAAAMLEAMENAEVLLMGETTLLNSILRETSDTVASLDRAELIAAMSTQTLTMMLREMRDTSASLMMIQALLDQRLKEMADSLGAIARGALLARAGLAAFGGTAAETAAKAGTANTMFRIWGTGIRLTGNALHWLVMGTGEILSTAIPAIVALTAAGITMWPTFDRIKDVMTNLVVASGSMRGAMINSVGPLHDLGVNMGILTNQVKPNAYIIFGAAINSLTGHFGAFSQMAQSASNVLSQFASKLSAELAGPLGQQVTGFFRDAVNYMMQWGQVLGNLAHGLMNFFGDLAGVGHLLLDVLVFITQAFVALTGNPVGQWVIRIVAGFSALYRYAQLMVVIFGFLNRALVAPFIGAVKWVAGLIAEMTVAIAEMAALDTETSALAVAFAVLDAALGPIGWAMLAIGAAVGIFMLAARTGKDATDQLIASIQKAPQNVGSLTNSFHVLSKAIQQLPPAVQQMTPQMARFGVQAGSSFNGASQDALKLIAQIRSTANSLINLDTGMAEAGIRTGALGQYMQVLSVATALTDSKVQQLNQAIDQYVGILTGGTSALASFTLAMSNLTTGTNRVTNLLGRGGSVTLAVRDFAQTLTQTSQAGAQAWQNFDNVITGSMQPMADWFRTAASLGAASGAQVRAAVLSMVAVLGQYASKSVTAQAILLGFARANGIVTSGFGNLMRQAHNAGGSLSTLTGITSKVTIALANLSQMAKNVAQALSSQATAALAQAALKASGFNSALSKLQTDMMNSAPPNVIHKDLLNVSSALQTGQQLAVTWGNQVSTSMAGTAQATTQHTGTMSQGFERAKLHQVMLQQEVNSASGQINAHTHGVASSTTSSMAQTASAFDRAKLHAMQLQSFIDSMHGKSITVTTNFVTTGSVPGAGVPGAGHPYHGAVYGYVGGGVVGAGTGGMDRIPAMLTLGEGVLTKAAVAAIGGPLGVRNLNDNPYLHSAGGGTGGGVIHLTVISPVHIDGSAVSTSQRTQTLIYNRRNPSNNLALRAR